ncbi:MAG: hypothetical protein AAFO69_13785 [Bacteroidota bacterium]
MKTILVKSVMLTAAMLSCITLLAQGPPSPPATPIDGGLGLLLAGGAVYGVKKIREYRNSKKPIR